MKTVIMMLFLAVVSTQAFAHEEVNIPTNGANSVAVILDKDGSGSCDYIVNLYKPDSNEVVANYKTDENGVFSFSIDKKLIENGSFFEVISSCTQNQSIEFSDSDGFKYKTQRAAYGLIKFNRI